jgi:acetyl-CoA carboxylase biotin carboxylase subunit
MVRDKKKVRKVLIVERGEMGLRALRVCVEVGIEFVVGFSRADENSLLVRKALEYSRKMKESGIAYIGAEPIEESYANVPNIAETAKLWSCDAIYSGYGPLAEDYISIKKFEKAGLKFIGPDSGVVEVFSNKLKSRELARRSGLKLLKAFKISSMAELAKLCLEGKLKYPFVIKSFFSGGGKGNYLVSNDEDLTRVLSNIDIDVKTNQYYVEEYISGKHIELQFVVDSEGVINLGTRDCSCQIDFQKFLEECPAVVDNKKIKEIEKRINRMLVDVGYRGVGTAEFIYDAKKRSYYFLEINPRIQVEVPTTESFFGIDLVKIQFLVAMSQKIRIPDKSLSHCHVIEARIKETLCL